MTCGTRARPWCTSLAIGVLSLQLGGTGSQVDTVAALSTVRAGGNGELLGTCCNRAGSEAAACAADPHGSFSLSVGLCWPCLADLLGRLPPVLGCGLVKETLLRSITTARSRQ